MGKGLCPEGVASSSTPFFVICATCGVSRLTPETAGLSLPPGNFIVIIIHREHAKSAYGEGAPVEPISRGMCRGMCPGMCSGMCPGMCVSHSAPTLWARALRLPVDLRLHSPGLPGLRGWWRHSAFRGTSLPFRRHRRPPRRTGRPLGTRRSPVSESPDNQLPAPPQRGS